jgi:hypothetical protein
MQAVKDWLQEDVPCGIRRFASGASHCGSEILLMPIEFCKKTMIRLPLIFARNAEMDGARAIAGEQLEA